MTKIFIGETSSTRQRICSQRTIHFLVDTAGVLSELADPQKDIIVLCEKRRAGGERLFASWDANYVVPTAEQCEAVWELVQMLLGLYPDVTQQFAGAFENGFRWGAVTPVDGISAREHIQYKAGGLFQEHYCLARARGCSKDEAMVLTTRAAKRGGKTPIPGVDHVHTGKAPDEVQSG